MNSFVVLCSVTKAQTAEEEANNMYATACDQSSDHNNAKTNQQEQHTITTNNILSNKMFFCQKIM